MKLEAEGQRAIEDPGADEIRSAVSLLSPPDRTFLILSRSATSYLQVAIVGSDRFVLERRDGSAGPQFRSARSDYSTREVVEILEVYRRGDGAWRDECDWRPIGPPARPDPLGRLSSILLAVGALLMFDSALALRTGRGDPIFGLETMDVLTIAFVAAMGSSVIDLRNFRTMTAMAKQRAIGTIGVGVFVVAIQLFERLTTR